MAGLDTRAIKAAPRHWLAVCALIFLTWLAAGLQPARAQSLNAVVTKRLCPGAAPSPATVASQPACAAPTALLPYDTVYFVVTVKAIGTVPPPPLDLSDKMGLATTGFVFNSGACAVTAGPAGTVVTAFPAPGTAVAANTSLPIANGLSLLVGQTVTCVIEATFTTPSNKSDTFIAAETGNPAHSVSQGTNQYVDPSALLPADLKVTKSVSAATLPLDLSSGPQTLHYKIEVANIAGRDVSIGRIFEFNDLISVPASGVPLTASLVAGSITCTNSSYNPSTNPDCPNQLSGAWPPITVSSTTGQNFLRLVFPSPQPGLIKAGATVTIEFDVTIDRVQTIQCVVAAGADGIDNGGFIDFLAYGATTTLGDMVNANNNVAPLVHAGVDTGVTNVDPNCLSTGSGNVTPPTVPPGPITFAKQLSAATPQPTNGFAWGSQVQYEITIANSSSAALPVSFSDIIGEVPGTPPFGAQTTVAVTCTPTAAACAGLTSTGLQTYPNAWDAHTVEQGVVTVPANDAVHIFLTVDLTPIAACRTLADSSPNLIRNLAQGTYTAMVMVGGVPTPESYSPSATVDIRMADVPVCQGLTVTKTVTPATVNRIVFNQQVDYDVSFANAGLTAQTFGTLFDAVRFTPAAYASQLLVPFSFTCGGTGVTGGYPASGAGSLTVVNTNQPSQGVRVLQNTTPVTIAAGAALVCHVHLKVSPPPPGDPYCMSDGNPSFENLAMLDVLGLFNPNMTFPTSPQGQFWDKSVLPLPHCFNLVVNKEPVGNGFSWNPGGPDVVYTFSVRNVGTHITSIGAAPNQVQVMDLLKPPNAPPGVTVVPLSDPCTGTTPPCHWAPSGWNPSVNPMVLVIDDLAAGATLTFSYKVLAPLHYGPNDEGAIDFGASSIDDSATPGAWYAYDDSSCVGAPYPITGVPSTCTEATVPVLHTNRLNVLKKVVNSTGGPLPATNPFAINAHCYQAPSYDTNTPMPLINGQGGFVDNIPVGSACDVTETLPSPNAFPNKACKSGLAEWAPAAFFPPQPVTIPEKPIKTKVVVTNTLRCIELGHLTVIKTTDWTKLPGGVAFPILVHCPPQPDQVVSLDASHQSQTIDLPLGTACTVTEQAPAMSDLPKNCHFETSYPGGQTIGVDGDVKLEVANTLICSDDRGRLTVFKTTDWTKLPAGVSFTMLIQCQPGGSQTVVLDAAHQSQSVPVPSGAACVVSELAPIIQGLPKNCWLETSYPRGQKVTIHGDTRLEVVNKLVCCKDDGKLTVTKTTDWDKLPSGVSFPMLIHCPPMPDQTVVLDAAHHSQTVSVPSGSCLVTELAPNMADLPKDCRFETGYRPGQEVKVDPTGEVEVNNRLICDAHLTLFKKTDWSRLPVGFSFTLVAHCPPGADQMVTLDAAHQSQTLSFPSGTVCVVSELAPNTGALPKGCHFEVSYPSGQKVEVVGTVELGVVNKLVCCCEKDGQLTVIKTAEWDRLPKDVSFPMLIHCPPAPDQTVVLDAAHHSQTISVPRGLCTVTELAPNMGSLPQNCHFDMSFGSDREVKVDPEASVEVVNKLVCDKPQGQLYVHKKTDWSALPAGVSFPMLIHCPPMPDQVVTLDATHQSAAAPVPLGADCKVTEQAPNMSSLPKNCHFDAFYEPGAEVHVDPTAEVLVDNKLVCEDHSLRLTVVKTLDGPWPAGVTYPVQVNCNPGGFSVTVSLTAATPSLNVPIPSNTSCSIAEFAPVGALPANCHWGSIVYPNGTHYTPGGIIAPPPLLEVHNSLVCPVDGTLIIDKSFTPGPVPPPSGSFPISVQCLPSGVVQTGSVSAANPQLILNGLPGGNSCTVTEGAGPTTGHCQWQASYPSGQSAVIVASGQAPHVAVVNTLVCPSSTTSVTPPQTRAAPKGGLGFSVGIATAKGPRAPTQDTARQDGAPQH